MPPSDGEMWAHKISASGHFTLRSSRPMSKNALRHQRFRYLLRLIPSREIRAWRSEKDRKDCPKEAPAPFHRSF